MLLCLPSSLWLSASRLWLINWAVRHIPPAGVLVLISAHITLSGTPLVTPVQIMTLSLADKMHHRRIHSLGILPRHAHMPRLSWSHPLFLPCHCHMNLASRSDWAGSTSYPSEEPAASTLASVAESCSGVSPVGLGWCCVFGNPGGLLGSLSPAAIDYRREDGPFPVFASCVTISHPDSLSSSETGVNPGIRSWKYTCLNELDARKPLVVSISQTSKALRLHNLV